MRELCDALVLNGLVAAGGWASFTFLDAPRLGLAVLALVVGFNLLLPLLARLGGHDHWLRLWAFLLPLSVFQVVPDWVLSQLLGILVFPDLGAPRVGGHVPVYMAGMWVIPLFWVLRFSRGQPLIAAALAFAVFAVAEGLAPVFGLWQPRRVPTEHGVALYVLLPEALLGWAAAFAERQAQGTLQRLLAAATVAVLYTGALVVSYFLMHRAAF